AIEFNYSIYSQSDISISISKTREADDWALEISKALGIKSYYNPIGGKSFYNKSKFERENIDIKFLKLNLYEYNQRRAKFEPGLSIIDVMMFNSPDTICKMLDDYELE
ncbi:MAG: WbqC family protein, partial [Candidatus Neomarinimicrobiota bacterium]